MILPASDWLRVRWSHLKLGYLSSLTFNHCGVRGFALLAGLFMEGFSSEEHVSSVTRGWRLYNEFEFFAELNLISSVLSLLGSICFLIVNSAELGHSSAVAMGRPQIGHLDLRIGELNADH